MWASPEKQLDPKGLNTFLGSHTSMSKETFSHFSDLPGVGIPCPLCIFACNGNIENIGMLFYQPFCDETLIPLPRYIA